MWRRIERVKHYSEIDTEAAYNAADKGELITAPAGWPTQGRIEFDNVCARYRPELPLVLEKVTFTVQANEKVGVVGRTGSGKSTLMVGSTELSALNCCYAALIPVVVAFGVAESAVPNR